MANEIDPLTRLVADDGAVDRELLADALDGLVRLNLATGQFSFTPGARTGMSGRQQVVAVLLARKALHLLDSNNSDCLKPQELEELSGIKGGTLRPTLKRLTDDNILKRGPAGAYSIPGYAVEEAASILREREGR